MPSMRNTSMYSVGNTIDKAADRYLLGAGVFDAVLAGRDLPVVAAMTVRDAIVYGLLVGFILGWITAKSLGWI